MKISCRYRNFKTFVSPRPVQFSCVAIDSTGEFVAAGGQDVFEAYLWSMKIGKLVEVSIEKLNTGIQIFIRYCLRYYQDTKGL